MSTPIRIDQPTTLFVCSDEAVLGSLRDGVEGTVAAGSALRIKTCRGMPDVEGLLERQAGSPVAVAWVDADSVDDVERVLASLQEIDPLTQIVVLTGDSNVEALPNSAEHMLIAKPVTAHQVQLVSSLLGAAWRKERQLARSQARLSLAERVAQAGHWEWNPRSGQARWGTPFARIFDVPPGRSGGSADIVFERIHPDDRLRVKVELERAVDELGSRSLRYRIVRADGTVRTICQESTITVGDRDAGRWTAASVRDVTDNESNEESIRRLAYFDPLTRLPNRSFLNDHLHQVLQHARRHGHAAAILHVDLDSFNSINATLGTATGDSILKEVAVRLEDVIRDCRRSAREPTSVHEARYDAVARFGADEFIIVLADVDGPQQPQDVAERIAQTLRMPFDIDDQPVRLSASIGVALYPDHAADEDALLRHGSVAMHAAKQEGRNTCRVYHPDMMCPRMERLHIEAKLREAVERGSFRIHLQPKIKLAGGELAGAEALLRWTDPDLGEISPQDFIPIAEETGLIRPLGDWVLQTVCELLQSWRTRGLARAPISVNMSPRQFNDRGLLDRIRELLDAYSIEGGELEIEITENVVMGEQEFDKLQLDEIREMGCPVSLDDFGTGYSSLSYLKRLPIDIVKIDRAFVRDILDDKDDQAILRAIITMAHQLRLLIVAEGVETKEQCELLRDMECDLIQGYVESRPLPIEEFEQQYLHAAKRLAS